MKLAVDLQQPLKYGQDPLNPHLVVYAVEVGENGQ